MSRRRRSGGEAEGGIQPKYRRAFGCVTWVNIGVLTFLLVAFLLSLPFRYIQNEVFAELQIRLALVASILYVPGLALGAALGVRTYRVGNALGTRAGAVIGATAGLTSYLAVVVALFEGRLFLLVPLLLSAGLLLYALFATGQSFGYRRWAALAAAALSVISGIVSLLFGFDLLGPWGGLFATASAAAGGFVGGFGYARAGGDEMIPPGATIRRREARQKPR